MTELEIAVKRSVKKIGEQSLIRFLNDINNQMHFKPGLEFQFIEQIVCQYFDVKSKELYKGGISTNIVNCRKIISYVLLKHTDTKDIAVCYLLQIDNRTLRRYKKQMFNLIEMPKTDIELHNAYLYLDNIFKSEPWKKKRIIRK